MGAIPEGAVLPDTCRGPSDTRASAVAHSPSRHDTLGVERRKRASIRSPVQGADNVCHGRSAYRIALSIAPERPHDDAAVPRARGAQGTFRA